MSEDIVFFTALGIATLAGAILGAIVGVYFWMLGKFLQQPKSI